MLHRLIVIVFLSGRLATDDLTCFGNEQFLLGAVLGDRHAIKHLAVFGERFGLFRRAALSLLGYDRFDLRRYLVRSDFRVPIGAGG